MLFAAAEPNPVDLYKTLVVLQFLGGLVLLGAQLIALARTNKAQKRDVRMVSDAVSKEEFDKHVDENREASTTARDELVDPWALCDGAGEPHGGRACLCHQQSGRAGTAAPAV
jgi:hypothetical protein